MHFLFLILSEKHSIAQDTTQHRIAILTSPSALVTGNYAKVKVRIQAQIKSRFVVGTDVKYFFSRVYPGYQVLPLQNSFSEKITQKGFTCM